MEYTTIRAKIQERKRATKKAANRR